jgi:hypothetical protein
MPYRAQMGGIFGSGLYPKQPPQNTAGDIIDAVTRGATTLIGAAYARKQAEREQARQDAADKLAQRAADRADTHDQWERTRAESQDAIATRREQRADFESGYTPASTTTKDVVQPGSVESGGLFGAPGKVTAPSITKQTATIPAAYDFAASKTAKAKGMDIQTGEVKRTERLQDAKTMADYRESLRKNRPNKGATTDSPAVHAQAAIRGQITEANQAIAKLTAQKKNLAPGTIPGDQERSDAIDGQLKPVIARRDSLVSVHDKVAGKLTSEAGISTGAPTIKSAYNAQKPDGSTIRGGGESAASAQVIPGAGPTSRRPIKQDGSTVQRARGATAPSKADGSTVRAQPSEGGPVPKADGSTVRGTPSLGKSLKRDGSTVRTGGKETITQAEAAALRSRKFTDAQIAAKYNVR